MKPETVKYLSDAPGRFWPNAIVWVSQSNLAYKGKVIDWPKQKRNRVGPGRALVLPIDKPGVGPKWCDSNRLEIVQYGGIEA